MLWWIFSQISKQCDIMLTYFQQSGVCCSVWVSDRDKLAEVISPGKTTNCLGTLTQFSHWLADQFLTNFRSLDNPYCQSLYWVLILFSQVTVATQLPKDICHITFGGLTVKTNTGCCVLMSWLILYLTTLEISDISFLVLHRTRTQSADFVNCNFNL